MPVWGGTQLLQVLINKISVYDGYSDLPDFREIIAHI